MRRVSTAFAVMSLVIVACGGDTKTKKDTSDTSVAETKVDDDGEVTTACGGQTGILDCPCGAGDTCDAGLVCVDGTCVTEVVAATGLSLPAGARGCEVLLGEGAGRVTDVRFGAGVRGTFIREAPRVAITVVTTGDADFADGVVEVLGTGTPPATVETARCVDAAGAVIAGAKVTLQ